MKSLLVTAMILALSTTALAQQPESRSEYDRPSRGAGVFIEPIVQFSQLNSEIKTSQLPLTSDNT
jgi:hypothetical protein